MKAEEIFHDQILTCSGYEAAGKYAVLLTDREFFSLWGDSPFFQAFVTKAMENALKETPPLQVQRDYEPDWDAMWKKIIGTICPCTKEE